MAYDLHTFTISVIGDTTNEKWHGTFKARVRMSHRDSMLRDRLRRQMLGNDSPALATPRAQSQAQIFSFLDVTLVEAPAWWKDNGNGQDLYDDNVVAAVFDEVEKGMEEAREKLKKQAEESMAALKAMKPEDIK